MQTSPIEPATKVAKSRFVVIVRTAFALRFGRSSHMNSRSHVLRRLAAAAALTSAILVAKSRALQPVAIPHQIDEVDGQEAVAGEVLVKFNRTLAAHERVLVEQQTESDLNDAVGASGVR